MNKAEFSIDAESVRKMFGELTSKDRKRVFRRAISGALNIVKKETIKNLRSVVRPSMINHKDKYGNTLRKGIKTKVYKNNQSGVIHILGNFKLKYFEVGTSARFNRSKGITRLKKRRATGSIPAYHFFRTAKQTKEREVFSSIERLLVQSIQRINNKYR